MLSGLKFIPRDQVQSEHHNSDDDVGKGSKKLARKKEKSRSRKKSSRYSSSDDESSERIKKGSRKKKKWYASDQDVSSQSESENEHSLDYEKKKKTSRRQKRKQDKRHKDSSEDEHRGWSGKKPRGRGKEMTSNVSNDSESDESSGEESLQKKGKKSQEKVFEENSLGNETDRSSRSIARKEMGLDWMLRPNDTTKENPAVAVEDKPDEAVVTEVEKVNPRELNPYFNENGRGYPHESGETSSTGNQLLSSSLVGDGGASWRLKALKRAKEQAAREGRKLDEVVEDRWGSLSHLAVSVATRTAAPTRAHLHAIKNRRKGMVDEEQTVAENDEGKGKLHHTRMKVPKVQDSLSWGKRKIKMSVEDSEVVSAAISGLNKFTNDGSFLGHFAQQKNEVSNHHADDASIYSENRVESSSTSKGLKIAVEDVPVGRPTLTANQLAAKVMQLRMKGKHEEAEKLMREAETLEVKQNAGDGLQGPQVEGRGRSVMQDTSLRQKRKDEDADMHLAKSIMRNHQYSMSGRADDEYDYDEGPRKKSQKRGGNDHKETKSTNISQRTLTQKERCQFCFENPNRPKHLVVAIANFAYLSLPQWEPLVQGHCCILTMQHESATRSVDDDVWDEIRNFKKCLMIMFAKQEKDVLFLETVIGISRQRRHCMVECIPMPREIAKQAPVYFKKAIDEAEDEWSQHNAKKLIDTSQKGLRGSIPKNFPYFYVEFGLDKGYVHVIDNEDDFQSCFGLNVIRGMLGLPDEDMHRRRKHESVDRQKQAVSSFARDWEPFDWTKQL